MNNSGVALACGICSIVIGILGGILFGVYGGGVGLALGILGIVMGTNAKKTGDPKGQSGFVTGLIGAIFSVIFIAGCAFCGLKASQSGASSNYGCAGCVGTACQAKSDVEKAGNEIKNAIENADWGFDD